MKLVWCDGDEWDDVVLPVSELMPDNDGPADPDGKLSPEHLSALVFIDLGGAFRSGIENGPFVFEPLGEQTIWLDDLKLLSEDPSPQKPEVAENVTVLNHYDAPLTGALIMGGEDRTVDYDDGDPEGDCLKLTYALSGNTIIALAQPVARGALKDAASVRLKVKASAQTQLVIALGETPDAPNLEETSYAYVEQIEAAAGWKELDIPVSRFQLDVGKHDPDGKLTLEKVQSVVIADASAMMAGQRVSNTLWLDELAVVR